MQSEYQVYVFINKMIHSVNTQSLCVSIKAFSKTCRSNAHHRTTSNWACSWRIPTVFRWLKRSYDGNVHNFHWFLSPENKDFERKELKACNTYSARTIWAMQSITTQRRLRNRGNEVPFIVCLRNNCHTLMHCNILSNETSFLLPYPTYAFSS